MKKYFIFAAAALVSLAACSEVNTLEVTPLEDNAIGFEAYTGSTATKGLTVVNDSLTKVGGKGIGVFAFYQPANNGVSSDFNTKKFAIPDFMYNQQVYCKTTAGKWEYTPLKYWPNNEFDRVSFFAYAPYDPTKAWDDLGFKTDANASKLTSSFPVYNEKASMVDYLFATPVLNKSKANNGDSPISFEFDHIMSKIGINLGVVVDTNKTSSNYKPMAWADANTVIIVESIEIKDIAESYDYTYTLGGATPVESWKANGSQNLKLTHDDFQNDTINTTNYASAEYQNLLKKEKVGTAAADTAFLFIAPQDLSTKKMTVTYTVKTTDPNNNVANNSTITNVIEANLIDFKSGYAYTLNLLIGMKTVKFDVEVNDWDYTTTAQRIDIPANIAQVTP